MLRCVRVVGVVESSDMDGPASKVPTPTGVLGLQRESGYQGLDSKNRVIIETVIIGQGVPAKKSKAMYCH